MKLPPPPDDGAAITIVKDWLPVKPNESVTVIVKVKELAPEVTGNVKGEVPICALIASE